MTISKAKPAGSAVVVTPSDSVDLALPSRAIWVGSSGNISVEMEEDGTAIVFTGVANGTLLPIAVSRVNSSLTTASSIVALY